MILSLSRSCHPMSRPDRREHGLGRRHPFERERAEPPQLLLRQAALKRIGKQKSFVQLAAEIGDARGKIHVEPDHGIVETGARADIAEGGVAEMKRDADAETEIPLGVMTGDAE